jgi:hypothetical protein
MAGKKTKRDEKGVVGEGQGVRPDGATNDPDKFVWTADDIVILYDPSVGGEHKKLDIVSLHAGAEGGKHGTQVPAELDRMNRLVADFCAEVVTEPLCYFSEADLQGLLYARLIEAFPDRIETSYSRGTAKSKGRYRTGIVSSRIRGH